MAACHGKADTGASWPPTTFGNSLKLIPHSSRLATLTFIAAGVVVVVVVVVVDCVVVVLVVVDSLVVVVGLGVVRGVVIGGLQNTQDIYLRNQMILNASLMRVSMPPRIPPPESCQEACFN